MSNPLKKVFKGVKKVFKKVVKVAKQVVQSKVFKAVMLAAAVYFTAGAAAGYFGAAGAATAGAGAATTAGGGLAAGGWAAAETAAVAGAATGGAAGVGAAASGIGGALSGVAAAAQGMTTGQALLGSAILTTGGNMASAYAQGKKEEELIDKIDKNQKHELDVFGMYNASQKQAGVVGTDSNGATEYNSPSPIQQVANVEPSKQQFYNSSQDSWSPVQKVANPVANKDRTAERTA